LIALCSEQARKTAATMTAENEPSRLAVLRQITTNGGKTFLIFAIRSCSAESSITLGFWH
jgi:hypothetical protein